MFIEVHVTFFLLKVSHVDIADTIVTLQAFDKVVGQIAEDFPSEEALRPIYNERNVIVQVSRY